MSETVESVFTVEDVTDRDIWLRDVERGLTVAVEGIGVGYGPDIQRKIDRLSKGDTICARLESRNPLKTVWAFDDVDIDDSPTAGRIHVEK
jgi:hypothetical protein